MGRGDKMDADVRAAFTDIKAAVEKLDTKFDTYAALFQAHCVEDARVQQQILSSSQAAHKRMDDHGEEHKTDKAGRVNLWIGVALAFLSGAVGALFSWFKDRGGKE
jgi:hypothetical protein